MLYEVKYYGGTIEIEAENCREAILIFEKTYTDHWHSVGPTEREIKSILPGNPEIELTHGNYHRILKDEQGWEKNYRAAAMDNFQLQELSTKGLKKKVKDCPF